MLKQDLNNIFLNNGINPQTRGEVELFRALIKVMNKRHFAFAKEYHANKGLVEHILQSAHAGPPVRCCEIADILMLFIDDNGHMRYTFMQNKRNRNIKYNYRQPLRKVRADCVQWDLLHHRCYLSDPLTTGLPQDVLSSAILDSAATYGIFLNEYNSQCVEMSYNIASDLVPVCPLNIPQRTSSRIFDILTNYYRVNLVNGYWEIEGTATLDDFESAAQAMLVGTPIEQGKLVHREIAGIILPYAYTCLREAQENRANEESHEEYFRVLSRCAERYQVDLRTERILPYSLVIIKAKKKYFATTPDNNCRLFNDCEVICDRQEIYSKLDDKDSFVILDHRIIDDGIWRHLKRGADKNWFVVKIEM